MKKIAVPVTGNNQIDNHFGHCEYYSVYTITDDNKILDIQTIKSEQGCGCKSNIAGVLSNQGVTEMLAGGIGAGAINVLNSCNIEVIRGCSGNANEVVTEYLRGRITDGGSSCSHNEHEHNCEH
jgi:predicted Fe-Mo cluster-binding NifX family protein